DVVAPKKKLPVARVAVVAVVLVAAAVALLVGFDVRGAIEQGMDVIRGAGPVTFFTAMALLPAVAVPASVFTFTAGPVFGECLGLPAVLAVSLGAFSIYLVLCYGLGRRALRPYLENGFARLGYRVPQGEEGDLTDLAIVVRVSPEIPFFVQN